MDPNSFAFIENLEDSDEFSKEELDILKGGLNSQESQPPIPEQNTDQNQQSHNEQDNQLEQTESNAFNDEILKAGQNLDQNKANTQNDENRQNENKNRMVPHGAFHQERELRKETESKLEALQGQFNQLQQQFSVGSERLQKVSELIESQQRLQQEQQQKQQEAQNQPPNKDEDLFGYLEWQNQQNASKLDQLSDLVTKSQDAYQDNQIQQRQQQQHEQLLNAYATDARNFMQQNPDFTEAYAHVINGRDGELQMMGYNDPQQRAQIISQEEQTIALQLMQQGKSPAQFIYEWAKQRGFQPAQANVDPNNQAEQLQQNNQPPVNTQNNAGQMQQYQQLAQNNQQQAPNAPQQQNIQQNGQQSGMDKVSQLAQNTAANKSLSGAGGGEVQTNTIRTLAAMSDSDFERLMEKHPNEIMRSLGAPEGSIF